MNVTIVSGNITADPELRFLPSGSGVCQFTVANNRKWKDRDGQLKEEVSFLGVQAFGKQAETIAQYFKKGSPILVSGRLRQESWEDKQTGKKQSKTLIVMESFEFMERGGSRAATPEPKTEPPTRGLPATAAAKTAVEDDSDSVPF
jgi:single-strand DNA-binding protein